MELKQVTAEEQVASEGRGGRRQFDWELFWVQRDILVIVLRSSWTHSLTNNF